MSSLLHVVGRALAALFAAPPAGSDPETMSLQDWADLPAYHPSAERAPC